MATTKITVSDLFELANNFTPKNKRAYQNIVADFTNVAKEKRENEVNELEKHLSQKEISSLLDKYSTDEWIKATTISNFYNPYPNLKDLLFLNDKKRTILAIKKLKKVKDAQFEAWDKFVSQYNKKSIEKEIENFNNIKRRTPLDAPHNIKILHVLLAVREYLSGGSNIHKKHIIMGVFGILAEKKDIIKLYHLSDTIKDGDTAQRRIQSHYNILERKYGVDLSVEFHGSSFGRSFHTGAQVIQIVGQSSEIALEKHGLKTCPKLFFMVNNANRSKHKNKRKAQGSQCLWARIQDGKSKVVHEVIGVDNDVFSVFKKNIIELYIIEGMPGDPHYGDLSKGSQFRSMHNFPYVQFLNTISEGGCPPGFRVKRIDIDEYIPDLIIEKNEAILLDPDHYGNGKSLCAHPNGVIGLSKELGVKLDKGTITGDFYHPDTGDFMYSLDFIPTEYLGRHTGKKCIWNGSSKTIDGGVFVELGISAEKPGDIVNEVAKAPIGTRVVFKKK